MRRHRCQRRGFVMTLVLAVMCLVALVLTVLATYSSAYYRSHLAERRRLTADAVCDSLAGYAQAHAKEWSARPPVSPVTVDIAALLPVGMTGSASLHVDSADQRLRARVHVHLITHRREVDRDGELDLGPAGPGPESASPQTQPA